MNWLKITFKFKSYCIHEAHGKENTEMELKFDTGSAASFHFYCYFGIL